MDRCIRNVTFRLVSEATSTIRMGVHATCQLEAQTTQSVWMKPIADSTRMRRALN